MSIFQAGLKAADPVEAILRHVKLAGDCLEVGEKRYDLARYSTLYAVGAGKASAKMAEALEHVLGGRLSGVVNVKYGHAAPLKSIRVTKQAIRCRMKRECGAPMRYFGFWRTAANAA